MECPVEDRIRLLHISDLHLATERPLGSTGWVRQFLGGIGDLHILEGALRLATKARHRLDAVLISGDIADSGKEQDLQFAAKYFSQSVSTDDSGILPYSSFATLDLPVLLVPGNHDRFLNELGSPGCKNFDRVFRDFWQESSRVSSSVVTNKSGTTSLCVVSADLSLREKRDAVGSLGYLGQGRAYKDVVDQLVSETKCLQNDGLPAIWMVHFPPSFPKIEENLELLESNYLEQAAMSCGIMHILCGHRHEYRYYAVGQTSLLRVFAAGSASHQKLREANTIHFLEACINHGEIRTLEYQTWAWAPERTRFIQSSNRTRWQSPRPPNLM